MAYAGQDIGQGDAYQAGTAANLNPVTGGMTTEHAAAVVVIGALVALIALRRGFRGVSVSGMTGGLVRP
jgi:hypothetical protein